MLTIMIREARVVNRIFYNLLPRNKRYEFPQVRSEAH